MSYFPPTGSVVAFQNDPSKLVGTVSVVGTLPVVTNNASVITVLTNSSVAVLQGTTPWQINVPSPSTIAYQAAGSVQAVSGTITLANPNSSVMLTASTNHSVIAVLSNSSVAVLQGTNPWSINMPSPSILTSQSANTASVYAVLSSITSVSILSTNTSRKGATIYNNAGTVLYLKLGTNATTSVYTVEMNNDDYYELPYGWMGVVAGITASNAGIINVTELT